jgi:hypothetical protein
VGAATAALLPLITWTLGGAARAPATALAAGFAALSAVALRPRALSTRQLARLRLGLRAAALVFGGLVFALLRPWA